MVFDPSVHHRRSIRLRKYDYSERGLYFITICTYGRKSLLGRIHDGNMIRNPAGDAVWRVWKDLPQRFPSIEMMDFIVMPNHIHAIVAIIGTRLSVLPGRKPSNVGAGLAPPSSSSLHESEFVGAGLALPAFSSPKTKSGTASRAPTIPSPNLGDIVGTFKSMATASVNKILHRSGPLWQRNYYEHIIRSGDDLTEIQNYIAQNPTRWSFDPDNPQRAKSSP